MNKPGDTPMDPADAPAGTFRGDLVRLMTVLDDHLRRIAGEFFFAMFNCGGTLRACLCKHPHTQHGKLITCISCFALVVAQQMMTAKESRSSSRPLALAMLPTFYASRAWLQVAAFLLLDESMSLSRVIIIIIIKHSTLR